MARGVRMIASGVPAQAVGWYPVSSRGQDQPGSLIAISRPLPADPEEARREYVLRYHRDDPFAPHHFLRDRRSMQTMSEIGGRRGLLSTSYGSELLPEYRVEHEVALYIRDNGRMLGALRIGRTGEDGDLDDDELEFLRCAQQFLEASYVTALAPPPALEHAELLTANGLTPREIEVARLAATGVTNSQIAHRLLIEETTVKTHLLHVFAKLDVRTRTELATRLGPASG